jgi:hypothetical protein
MIFFQKLWTASFAIILISLSVYAGEILIHYVGPTIFDLGIILIFVVIALYFIKNVNENYTFQVSFPFLNRLGLTHRYMNMIISALFFIYIVWAHATNKKEENDIWQMHYLRHEIRDFLFLLLIMKRPPTPNSASKA